MRLASPPGMQTRPTADRVKEALFSIIVSRWGVADARVLDLCAGTGALGIEALSRGAAFCCSIEHDRTVAPVLERNLTTTGLRAKAELIRGDVRLVLEGVVSRLGPFDLIFFDPPYAGGLYLPVLQKIAACQAVTSSGVVVVECSSKSELADDVAMPLFRVDRRVYGDTALEFYMREQ